MIVGRKFGPIGILIVGCIWCVHIGKLNIHRIGRRFRMFWA